MFCTSLNRLKHLRNSQHTFLPIRQGEGGIGRVKELMGERLDAGMLSRDLHIYLVFLLCAFFMESTITLRSGQACTYLVYLLEQAKILTKIGQVKKSMCLTTFKAFSFCRQFRLRQFGPLLLCSLRYTCRWQLEQKLLHECYVFPCNENFTILTSYFINFFFTYYFSLFFILYFIVFFS